jgi:formylglycine-generating enzyme required for sulfatase activity
VAPARVAEAATFVRVETPIAAPTSAQGGGPTSSTKSAACPSGMVLVEGEYCPEPILNCLEWMDPPGPFHHYRCAKYAKPVCGSNKRTPLLFCIDELEYTKAGEKLPLAHQSFTTAKGVCESQGKRLCMESEWQFACEGPDMHPYPYGDGLTRDATACNIDRMNLGRANDLTDYREPSGSHAACVSPFGVHDMSGNIEEWAQQDAPPDRRDRSTMKGAWWLPGRNTCRARTVGHGEVYEGSQVGVRCCAAAK